MDQVIELQEAPSTPPGAIVSVSEAWRRAKLEGQSPPPFQQFNNGDDDYHEDDDDDDELDINALDQQLRQQVMSGMHLADGGTSALNMSNATSGGGGTPPRQQQQQFVPVSAAILLLSGNRRPSSSRGDSCSSSQQHLNMSDDKHLLRSEDENLAAAQMAAAAAATTSAALEAFHNMSTNNCRSNGKQNNNSNMNSNNRKALTSSKSFPFLVSNFPIATGGSARIFLGRRIHPSEFDDENGGVFVHNSAFDLDASLYVALKKPFALAAAAAASEISPDTLSRARGARDVILAKQQQQQQQQQITPPSPPPPPPNAVEQHHRSPPQQHNHLHESFATTTTSATTDLSTTSTITTANASNSSLVGRRHRIEANANALDEQDAMPHQNHSTPPPPIPNSAAALKSSAGIENDDDDGHQHQEEHRSVSNNNSATKQGELTRTRQQQHHARSTSSCPSLPSNGLSPEQSLSRDELRAILARCHRERLLLRFLPTHPTIVPVLHASKDFLVMPLMDGDLSAFIQEQQQQQQQQGAETSSGGGGVGGGIVTEQQVQRVVFVLCSAIEHLHKHDIAHRDIKPSNILVKRVTTTTTQPESSSTHHDAAAVTTPNGNISDNSKEAEQEQQVDEFTICLTDFSAAHLIPLATSTQQPHHADPCSNNNNQNNADDCNASRACSDSAQSAVSSSSVASSSKHLWNRGSPGYRPPEILMGRNNSNMAHSSNSNNVAALDGGGASSASSSSSMHLIGAADMWGVGCIAVELLLGKKQIFAKDSEFLTFHRIHDLLLPKKHQQQQTNASSSSPRRLSGTLQLGAISGGDQAAAAAAADCSIVGIIEEQEQQQQEEGRLWKDLRRIGVSDSCVSFLKTLLEIDPRRRSTAQAALEHNFLRGLVAEQEENGAGHLLHLPATVFPKQPWFMPAAARTGAASSANKGGNSNSKNNGATPSLPVLPAHSNNHNSNMNSGSKRHMTSSISFFGLTAGNIAPPRNAHDLAAYSCSVKRGLYQHQQFGSGIFSSSSGGLQQQPQQQLQQQQLQQLQQPLRRATLPGICNADPDMCTLAAGARTTTMAATGNGPVVLDTSAASSVTDDVSAALIMSTGARQRNGAILTSPPCVGQQQQLQQLQPGGNSGDRLLTRATVTALFSDSSPDGGSVRTSITRSWSASMSAAAATTTTMTTTTTTTTVVEQQQQQQRAQSSSHRRLIRSPDPCDPSFNINNGGAVKRRNCVDDGDNGDDDYEGAPRPLSHSQTAVYSSQRSLQDFAVATRDGSSKMNENSNNVNMMSNANGSDGGFAVPLPVGRRESSQQAQSQKQQQQYERQTHFSVPQHQVLSNNGNGSATVAAQLSFMDRPGTVAAPCWFSSFDVNGRTVSPGRQVFRNPYYQKTTSPGDGTTSGTDDSSSQHNKTPPGTLDAVRGLDFSMT